MNETFVDVCNKQLALLENQKLNLEAININAIVEERLVSIREELVAEETAKKAELLKENGYEIQAIKNIMAREIEIHDEDTVEETV